MLPREDSHGLKDRAAVPCFATVNRCRGMTHMGAITRWNAGISFEKKG